MAVDKLSGNREEPSAGGDTERHVCTRVWQTPEICAWQRVGSPVLVIAVCAALLVLVFSTELKPRLSSYRHVRRGMPAAEHKVPLSKSSGSNGPLGSVSHAPARRRRSATEPTESTESVTTAAVVTVLDNAATTAGEEGAGSMAANTEPAEPQPTTPSEQGQQITSSVAPTGPQATTADVGATTAATTIATEPQETTVTTMASTSTTQTQTSTDAVTAVETGPQPATGTSVTTPAPTQSQSTTASVATEPQPTTGTSVTTPAPTQSQSTTASVATAPQPATGTSVTTPAPTQPQSTTASVATEPQPTTGTSVTTPAPTQPQQATTARATQPPTTSSAATTTQSLETTGAVITTTPTELHPTSSGGTTYATEVTAATTAQATTASTAPQIDTEVTISRAPTVATTTTPTTPYVEPAPSSAAVAGNASTTVDIVVVGRNDDAEPVTVYAVAAGAGGGVLLLAVAAAVVYFVHVKPRQHVAVGQRQPIPDDIDHMETVMAWNNDEFDDDYGTTSPALESTKAVNELVPDPAHRARALSNASTGTVSTILGPEKKERASLYKSSGLRQFYTIEEDSQDEYARDSAMDQQNNSSLNATGLLNLSFQDGSALSESELCAGAEEVQSGPAEEGKEAERDEIYTTADEILQESTETGTGAECDEIYTTADEILQESTETGPDAECDEIYTTADELLQESTETGTDAECDEIYTTADDDALQECVGGGVQGEYEDDLYAGADEMERESEKENGQIEIPVPAKGTGDNMSASPDDATYGNRATPAPGSVGSRRPVNECSDTVSYPSGSAASAMSSLTTDMCQAHQGGSGQSRAVAERASQVKESVGDHSSTDTPVQAQQSGSTEQQQAEEWLGNAIAGTQSAHLSHEEPGLIYEDASEFEEPVIYDATEVENMVSSSFEPHRLEVLVDGDDATARDRKSVDTLDLNRSCGSVSSLLQNDTESADVAESDTVTDTHQRKRKFAFGSRRQVAEGTRKAAEERRRSKPIPIPVLVEPADDSSSSTSSTSSGSDTEAEAGGRRPAQRVRGHRGEGDSDGEESLYTFVPSKKSVGRVRCTATADGGGDEIDPSPSSPSDTLATATAAAAARTGDYVTMQPAGRFQSAARQIRWGLKFTKMHKAARSDEVETGKEVLLQDDAQTALRPDSCDSSNEGYIRMSFMGNLGPELETALARRSKRKKK